MTDEVTVPKNIHLYKSSGLGRFDVSALEGFLQQHFPEAVVDVREDYFSYWLQRSTQREKLTHETAMRVARSRVLHVEDRELNPTPSLFVIAQERAYITGEKPRPAGMFFDGHCWVAIHYDLLQDEEINLGHCHIVLTDQVLLLWSRSARRYHARVPILGFPAFISVAGLTDDSARNEIWSAGQRMGFNFSEVEAEFTRKHLGQVNSTVEEMTKVYVLQVLLYHSTGSLFRSKQRGSFDLAGVVASRLEPGSEEQPARAKHG